MTTLVQTWKVFMKFAMMTAILSAACYGQKAPSGSEFCQANLVAWDIRNDVQMKSIATLTIRDLQLRRKILAHCQPDLKLNGINALEVGEYSSLVLVYSSAIEKRLLDFVLLPSEKDKFLAFEAKNIQASRKR